MLVEPGSVAELAAAVVELARSHSEYDPAVLHAYMRDLYGLEQVRGQLLDLYAEVLARPAGAR